MVIARLSNLHNHVGVGGGYGGSSSSGHTDRIVASGTEDIWPRSRSGSSPNRLESNLGACVRRLEDVETSLASVRVDLSSLVEGHAQEPHELHDHGFMRSRSDETSLTPRLRASLTGHKGSWLRERSLSSTDNSSAAFNGNRRPSPAVLMSSKSALSSKTALSSSKTGDTLCDWRVGVHTQCWDQVLLNETEQRRRATLQQKAMLVRYMSTDFAKVRVGTCCCKNWTVTILHPEARPLLFWIWGGCLAIGFELIAAPFCLAFEVDPRDYPILFVLVSMINVYFLLDIVLVFFTGFRDHKGAVVTDMWRISKRYACSHLFVDLMASVPWEWLPLANDERSRRGLRLTKPLRLFRIMRLLRLLRFTNLSSFWSRAAALVEVQPFVQKVLNLVMLFVKLLIMVHGLSCIWYLYVTLLEEYYSQHINWIEAYLRTARYDRPYYGTGEAYVWSVYYIVTTMTTVGYGDMHPQNLAETFMVIPLLLASQIVFSWLAAHLIEAMSELREQSSARKKMTNNLKSYMNWRGLPSKLQGSITQYLLFVWDNRQGHDQTEAELLEHLPPVLRYELCYHIYGAMLMQQPYLAWMQYEACIKHLSSLVTSKYLEVRDMLFRVGQCSVEIHVLCSGAVWLSRDEFGAVVQRGSQGSFTEAVNTALQALTGLQQNLGESINEGAKLSKRQLSRALKGKHGPEKPSEAPTAGKEPLGPLQSTSTSAYATTLFKKASTSTVTTFTKSMKTNILNQDFKGVESPAMLEAQEQLKERESKRHVAAKRLQEFWRQYKMQQQEFLHHSQRTPKLSREVMAPGYFGESCLWEPVERWHGSPARYQYTATCTARSEVVTITRGDIKSTMEVFSPWLPERFEFYRQAVVRGLTNKDKSGESSSTGDPTRNGSDGRNGTAASSDWLSDPPGTPMSCGKMSLPDTGGLRLTLEKTLGPIVSEPESTWTTTSRRTASRETRDRSSDASCTSIPEKASKVSWADESELELDLGI